MTILTSFALICLQLIQPSKKELDIISKNNMLDSLIFNHNVQEAGKLYDSNFVLTTSSGKKKNKTDILKEIGNEKLLWEINKTSEVEVRVVGNTAVLTGVLHQKGTFMDKPFDYYIHVTDTWVYQKKEWHLLAGHATVLPK